jgi:2-phospho-L-lactate transferase/gluconeogenesis factor (CofD/UPF0052 family)
MAEQSLRVVLFSGGSGTKTITEHFARHPQISLTILINCYDDGHSTGRLRKFIPGMLGPSDVRKNINNLMPATEQCHQALRRLSDRRLPMGAPFESSAQLIESFGRMAPESAEFSASFEQLTLRQATGFARYCRSFHAYLMQQASIGIWFDFTDCALGNIVFAGCFLEQGRDFNRTVEELCGYYEISSTLLNITLGENLFLIAEREDGSILRSEADIVEPSAAAGSRISRIALIDERTYRDSIETADDVSDRELRLVVARGEVCPELNPRARQAIENADVIIYGPGTQHSSLLPSYLTRGSGAAITGNVSADKIFIANIHRDADIQADDANDLADKFMDALRRSGTETIEWRKAVTHFFVQHRQEEMSAAAYVPFDPKTFRYPLDTVRVRDWETGEGKHHGGYVFDELQQIVQSRIQISMQPLRHLVSIIVPALNEERTVEEALMSVNALDFGQAGLSKEVILVDGGSTDRTLEIARSVRGVRIFRLPAGEFGRGASLRHGVSQARGNIIVFFPSDNEYRAEDIHPIVSYIVSNQFEAVFGTRTVKCTDLDAHLRSIYGKSYGIYLLSKYGGILISILTLLLYNRYVTDSLTSVKAFDAKLLRSLDLKSDGVDLDTEIVAKLSRLRKYILEIPVDFSPRTKAQGKKIGVSDGLWAIEALVRYRF